MWRNRRIKCSPRAFSSTFEICFLCFFFNGALPSTFQICFLFNVFNHFPCMFFRFPFWLCNSPCAFLSIFAFLKFDCLNSLKFQRRPQPSSQRPPPKQPSTWLNMAPAPPP
ncbi:hypothetical protein V8G54_023766 [Vigna mungo]|uniref:Uncharacterized protein n=1 Tax=Vigna mungo TaxID=3915 RepID=A0AAQ3N5A8_VIGMU